MLRRVHCQAQIARDAADVWAVLRDFCHPWHPAIATMEGDGSVRRFTVHGDKTVYAERLTYLSDSDRVLSYTHLEGIKGATRYDAKLRVLPTELGCQVHWLAEVEATAERADEIAEGTREIFQSGLAALDHQKARPGPNAPMPGDVEMLDRTVPGAPRLAFTVAGDGPGPLVLFLHGIGGNRSNWAAQVSALADRGPVAAMDLRGYGDSALGDAATTVDDHCNDILRVIEALRASEVVLCGLSFGAWIATSFAMRHPHLLRGLVVAGGCTGMSEAAAQVREGFRVARLAPLDAGQTPAGMAPQVVQTISGPEATEDMRAVLLASMAAIPTATYRDAVMCFTHPPEMFDFAKITCPVLLMTGAHDQLAPPAEIRSVAERMHRDAPRPDICFEVLPGAGHVCNLEAPDAFNATLSEFLARLGARRFYLAHT
ncbi:MAG: alpha/beta fold hydrolase [Pseudomonadota bacterium]